MRLWRASPCERPCFMNRPLAGSRRLLRRLEALVRDGWFDRRVISALAPGTRIGRQIGTEWSTSGAYVAYLCWLSARPNCWRFVPAPQTNSGVRGRSVSSSRTIAIGANSDPKADVRRSPSRRKSPAPKFVESGYAVASARARFISPVRAALSGVAPRRSAARGSAPWRTRNRTNSSR